MSIWFHKEISLQAINDRNKNTLCEHVDLQVTKIGDDYLEGTMPVDNRTVQPFGILHGGASCVLAESLGSIAANLVVDPNTQHAVGLSINASHIKAVRNGHVRGVAKAVHLGKTTQVWQIDMFNDAGALTATSRLTMAVITRLQK